ncbi:MAG: hypothetical protein ACI95C_002589 [Pseudohongiellaceae bacterium]|jgi:hypothetical protein
MLIKFESNAAAPFVMLDGDARPLLKYMGHGAKLEGAVSGHNLLNALEQLEQALIAAAKIYSEERLEDDEDDEDDPESEPPLAPDARAAPLLDMLRKAKLEDASVMWQPE